jgi:asparagine synthase (glutamine-hydrolysing)
VSAIAGILRPDGRPVDRGELGRMVQSLAHRGPDGSKAWVEGPVGLGHLMLRTTPESLEEELPLLGRGGDLAVTADARIDNRGELINVLRITGRPHDEISDSELILKAYERWGEACPKRLVGDFSFAVWDRRRRTLFCARDHMGVKPFYYHHRPGRLFAFGSEIKALLSVEEVPRRLNEVRVADYLVSNFEDKEITFYWDIWRLPPAHIITVGREGVKVRKYWSLDPTRELRLGSDQEYVEAFREVFTEAVRCRLRSAVQVGSQLSGGLDSSSIACVARDLLAEEGRGERLRTFSAVFPEVPESDESPYIDAVVAKGGLEPHKVSADRLSPLGDIERILWHEDEAFYIPNLFMSWSTYSAAHGKGVRVPLSGEGGDDTVSHGVAYLAELARGGRWWALATEIDALSKRWERPRRRILLPFVIRPLAPESARWVWRTLRRSDQSPWPTHTIVNPSFARRIGLKVRYQALQGDLMGFGRTSRQDHWQALTTGLIPYAAEVLDRAAAAFSVEIRYPFFDRRLAEFCLALPPEQKLSGGWTRVVMRRALDSTLPKEIQWRGSKTDLGHNFVRSLLLERAPLEKLVANTPKTIEKYVTVPALQKAYCRFVSHGERVGAATVWSMAILALWLRQTKLTP